MGTFKCPPVVQSLEMPFRYAKSIQHALKAVPSCALVMSGKSSCLSLSAVVCTLSYNQQQFTECFL